MSCVHLTLPTQQNQQNKNIICILKIEKKYDISFSLFFFDDIINLKAVK